MKMGVEAAFSCSSSKFFASSTSNAAGAPHTTLPFPVVIDLGFRDAGLSRRAARRSVRHRIDRSCSTSVSSTNSNSTSRFGSASGSCLERTSSARSLESCICRANSFEQAGNLPEREDAEDQCLGYGGMRTARGIEQALKRERRVDADYNGRVVRQTRLNFEAAINSEADEFRRASSLEFFSRMRAMEASHQSGSRALNSPSNEFFRGCSDPPRPSPGQAGVESSAASTSEQAALCELGMGAGVQQLPSSIRRLRRRNSEAHVRGTDKSRLSPAGECAIKRAFSSMVYMIKVVQSRALQIRQVLFPDWDAQEVLLLVHREMHSSFVWLFQQVFACTPLLMVSVMILLANFTVHSMEEINLAFTSVTETPASIALFLSSYAGFPQPSSSSSPRKLTIAGGSQTPLTKKRNPGPRPLPDPAASLGDGGAGSKNNSRSAAIAESFDGDAWLSSASAQRSMYSEDRDPAPDSKLQRGESGQDLLKAWAESTTVKNLTKHVQLEQETIGVFVAPVVARLESDNYACFDRTDLEYQDALAMDPTSPLLLANYAQFLYVVRHNNDRAEEYFHRAMRRDPLDSIILGRFASFLWLGRGNRAAAERAYKAAIAADPESSFSPGSYAHFLWHAGDGDSCVSVD